MSSKKIAFCAFAGFLALAGLFVYYAYSRGMPIAGKQKTPSSNDENALTANRTAHVGDPIPDVAKNQRTTMSSGPSEPKDARSIFTDENVSLTSRFSSLMEMVDSGDRDALQLAFQIQRNCSMWAKLSADTYLPGVWKPQMGVALTDLQAKCAGLSQLPQAHDLADIAKNKPNDTFEGDVRDSIRQAFADNGEDQAVAQALAAYERRPDPTTAAMIADTLSKLDVTNLDPNFQFDGLGSSSPDYRRSIFETALNILACDYGVPCGPGSEVVLSLCVNGGVCPLGYSLDQIYTNVLLSGEAAQDVQNILDALRKRGVNPSP